MGLKQLISNIGRKDRKLVGRDGILLVLLLFILYIALILRFGLPWANGYLADKGLLPNETITMSLANFYPMIVVFMTLFTGALIVGGIFGFLLLDEKDDNTLEAMMVTPIPLSQYMQYYVIVSAVLAFFAVFMMLLIINQVLLPIWQLLLLSAGASLTAPILMLFLINVSENKVQGMSYSKFFGIAGFGIMVSWFVTEPYQYLFGLLPPYWISKAYWLALENNSWWVGSLFLGIFLQAVMINWLIKRFTKVSYRFA